MIISHRHKFIFVKTQKTAGTSLEIGLSEHCGPDDVITPITAEDERLRSELGYRGPQNFRLPLSKYSPQDVTRLARGHRLKYRNHIPARDIIRLAGQDVWDDYLTFTIEREPFGKAISAYYWWMKEPRPPMDEFFDSVGTTMLSNWHAYTLNDHVAVDVVLRFERLHEDVEALRSRLGLPHLHLPRAKGGYRKDRSHYSQVLTPTARTRIETVCAKEIRHFGYAWLEA